MKNILNIALLVAMGLFLNSCYYDAFPEEILPDPDPDAPIENVSYATDIAPLWANDCVGCHSGSLPPNLTDDKSFDELLNGYVIEGDAEASILYNSLLGTGGTKGGIMPPGQQWSNANINLVKTWINQGALDN